MTNRFRGQLLATTLFAVACGAPALAQDNVVGATPTNTATVPATSETTDGDVIVVTGSRLGRPDLASSSPVATINAEALKQTNTVTVEQILGQNPQFVVGEGQSSNNPGDGAATVDLRGLGSQRNLVLIDGKRAPTYDTTGSVDVNTIPTALIKRIDVLTGGASAVYGSDAISGVVNFILDDRFTGLRADLSSQVTTRGDAPIYDASLTGGVKIGDRGNLVLSGGYSKRQELYFASRPGSAVTLDSSDLVTLAGSSNTIPTAFDTGQGRLQVTPSGALTANVQTYNFNPVNLAQLPLERYNAMGLFRYELADNVELYARGSYIRSKVSTNLASTATAGFFFNIDPANPFLTAGERAVFFDPATATINDGSGVAADPTARAGTSQVGIRRRIVETGGRLGNRNTDGYQGVGGLRGTLGSFRYDVFAQYGETIKNETLRNDLSYTALQQALDVVPGPNGPRCFNQANGCVPLNLFVVGTLPQNALAFVLRNASQRTKITQLVAGANVGGDLNFLKSPFANGAAAINVGVEYRRETGATTVDSNYASGDLIYYGQGQNIFGSYNVKEVYGEAKIPLVQDRPFFYSLGLEGGYRYSKYSTVGGVSTWKVGGDWAPVNGVRFRSIYQRAVRAPNIYELFSPVVAGTGSLNADPCAGPGISAATATICIAQGAPPRAIGSIPVPISGQINVFQGGNTKLQAERSETFTAGVVLNPPSLRNLSASFDYYSIRIGNAIDSTPPFITVAQCFTVDRSATAASCRSIVRNTLDGSLSGPINVGVPQQLGNISVIRTNGLDFTVGYRGGEREGFSYAVSYAGNYVLSYRRQSDPTAAAVECGGYFGSACNLEPIPNYKHVADLTLKLENISLLSRWRYLGSVRQDVGTDILRSRISPQNYFDFTLGFDVNEKFNLRLGVINAFDKKAPIVGDTVGADANGGSTFPNTYDVIGRRVFASVSVGF